MTGKLYNKRIITCAILTLTVCPAYAASLPDSGTALEGAKPPAIERPVQKIPEINVEEREPAVSAGGQQKIMVKEFRLSGELLLPANELLKLIQNEAGREINLNELNKLADKLTKYLRQKGYLVAFAYIPAQDIKDGVVEIDIVPGKYGQIKFAGDGHIDREQLKAMLFTARPGMVITRAPLERALLLISDISGVNVKATLTPGETTGTADLVLETADTDKINVSVYADNWGNRYTGRTRYGTQLTVNNFSNNGDAFNLGGLTTFNGINNYNFGYSAQLGYDGVKAEIKYSHVGYTLGDTFADLGATGRAAVTR
ncbi:Heme/hemopexin transporter protein HuxB precursor [Sporomusa ovata DSM 2662]|uniref:Hemolysin activation/secretion protein n=1 Tax=Sporomusa ovata TaxID=2378 RepID=A0A0U1KUT9_9FIRM|nr:POTRA domain-containing protein [Sporomusa ovata]EQB29194.1 heme/hemopexin transporter protein HuxB [Sporomusa ovata DSM 2662]CQR71230.1 Hemolysin activation/secretion protein [Sporomusa ovata]